MYGAPPVLESEVFSLVPERLRLSGSETAWSKARGEGPKHSFLEGPSFDRDGNLYCVDLAHGRIFQITPGGDWAVFAQYDGEPNGLKIHRDGRIFVADKRRRAIYCFAPRSGERSTVVDSYQDLPLKGPNDLFFGPEGDLFFTDQGSSSLADPSGRVFRLRASGEIDLLLDGLAGPNGLVLDKSGKTLLVAVTRLNQVVSIPLLANHQGVGKCGVFLYLSGSPAGPDGMALDEAGNLAVVHAGFGTVWLFSPMGEPLYRIRSCAGMRTTNVAYGGVDRRTLFITEGEQGAILKVRLPMPGRAMYSHQCFMS